MKIGSIASNPNKIRIMNLLLKKEMSLKQIAKSTRMPEISLKTIIDELVKDGFVESTDKGYIITESGKKALKSIK